MDIVDFWKKQVYKWNEEEKCDLCWSFSAPLTESAVNIVQSTEETKCCVKVMLVRERVTAFSTANDYDLTTGLLKGVTCNKGFQLLFLVESNIGLNNYNEINGHPTDESKWSNILQVLEDCISCDAFLDFCSIIGVGSRVTTWQGQQVINYLDSAYAGYRVTVNFQNTK